VKTQRELQVFKGHRVSVVNVVFSKDGRRLFTSAADGEIRVWDAASGQLLLTLRGHPMETRLALQPDETLVSASIDGIRFWRAPSLPVPESVARN
jgi:WD40 repeat protein